MLERLAGNEYYFFLDGFSGYFQIPIDPLDQEKTTLHIPLPGHLTIVACLLGLQSPGTFQSPGQRKTKHFQPIHYASKTMTEAQAHYTTTEKELLAVVEAFREIPAKTWSLVQKHSVYGPCHSALKYLLAKQDAKPRLLRWILLLQEFNVVIRDKKGAENLAAYHLSRLENLHQSELEKKEITETFPLETLGMITFLLFVMIVPYGLPTLQITMRGTSLSRECRPSRKTSFSKMSNITSGMTPFYLRSVRAK
ncbi:reverse transcriptase domain-containing protein [Tanacetum coccineum]